MSIGSGATFDPDNGAVITGTGATLTGSGTANVVRTTGTGEFKVQYAFGTYDLTNLTVNYTGAGSLVITSKASLGGANYSNLVITTTGNSARTLEGDITATNILITGTGTGSNLSGGTYQITLTGDFTNNSSATTPFNGSTGTVAMNGTGAQAIAGTGATKFNTLSFNNTSRTISVTSTGVVSVTAAFTNPSNITLNAGAATLSFGNSFTNSGTFTAGTSTVSYTSTTAGQTISGSLTGSNKFNNVVFNNASPGTYTFSNAADIAGNITIAGTGTVTATTGTLKVAGNFVRSAGTFAHNSGTIELNGTGTQTVTCTNAFNNVTISNTGGTVSAGSALTINGALTTAGASVLDMVTFQMLGTPTATAHSGNLNTQNTTNPAIPNGRTWGGTVAYNSSGGNQTMASGTYNNLVSTGTAGTRTFAGATNVAGNYSLTTTTGATLLGGALDVDGNILITGAATSNIFDASASNYQINVGGNWTVSSTSAVNLYNSGRTATVVFDGTGAQTIVSSGGSAVPNFYTFQNSNTTGTVTIRSNTDIYGDWVNNGTIDNTTYTNTVSFKATSSGRTISGNVTGTSKFHNLTFNSGTGSWSLPANVDVANNFTMTAAGTVTAPSGTLKIGGNFVRTSGTFTHNSGTVEMNGTGAQVFPTNVTTFNNFTISNTASTVSANAAVTINGALTTASASTLDMVTAQLLGTITATAHNGTLLTQNTVNPPIPNGITWGGIVNYNSSTGTQFVSNGTYNNLVSTATTGARTYLGATNVTGNYSVTTTSGVSTLGGALDVDGNVSVTGTTATNILDVSGSNYQINVGGNWTVSSSSATALLNGRAGTVVFDGTGTQTISASSGSVLPNFFNLTDNNTSNALAVNTNTNVTGTLSVSASATVTPTAGVQFNASAAAGTISGSGTVKVTRTAATADYNNQYKFTTNTLSALTVDYSAAAAQNVNSYTYGTLRTSGSGTKTAQGNLTVNDGLNVGSSTTLDMGASATMIAGTAPTYTVSGTLKTSVPTATSSTPLPSGATWNGSGTVEYATLTGAQSVVGGTYNNLTLGNTSGTNTAEGTITVNGVVTIGKLSLGGNNLNLAAAATLSGVSSSNYIVATGTGKLRKTFTANGSFAYPVGDASNYSPVTLNVSGSGYSGAYAEVNVTATKHANNANADNYLKRYWTVNTSGITAQSYSATATYLAGDVQGSDASMSAGSYAGSLPWVKYSAANTGAKTITATSLTGASNDITGLTTANPIAVSSSNVEICEGASTTLSATGSSGDPSLTYSWAPSTGLSATTGASVVASPTTTVTYTLTVTDGNGFTATASTQVSVNPAPAAISGNPYLCIGTTTTLGNSVAGGTWSSSNTGIATVGSSDGVVSGVAAGTANITYSMGPGGGCQVTQTVTVSAVPTSITGATQICGFGTTTLSTTGLGGTWSSEYDTVATIDVNTGVVNSVTLGRTLMTYYINAGCSISTYVTVNPTPGPIGGIKTVCTGYTTSLVDAPSGGTWSSTNTAVATIGTSGTVNGLTAGTTTISYTLSTGCYQTTTVTVNQSPSAITGLSVVCQQSTITLSNADAGGTWTSAIPAAATVGSSTGVVTGIGGGTVNISYTFVSNGCAAIKNITLNPLPQNISGTLSVCEGATTTALDATAGGTWAGSNDAIATVGSSTGILTGISAGNNTITYTLATGCYRTATVTVNQTAAAITGSVPVCSGSTITLSSATGGGTWQSGNAGIAPTNSTTGVVTGSNAGTTTVTYRLPNGCRTYGTLTVNAVPNAISGAASVCQGLTLTLNNGTVGGTWSSTNTGVATVGTVGSSAVVTGVGGGTSTISYTLGTGCASIKVVTVNVFNPITGTTSACVGSGSTLSNATAGGTWVSSNPSLASIGTTGIVSAIAPGTVTISYTLATGCRATAVYTVYPSNPITGSSVVCTAQTTPLNCSPTGGTWSSSNTGVATIGTSGIVSGVAAGTTIITYTLSSGCYQTYVMTVNAGAAIITGPSAVCVSGTITLNNATVGGTWSSGNTAIATIGSSTGIVSAIGNGPVSMVYTLANGCAANTTITVNPLPYGIAGTLSACVGDATTLSNTMAGGDWSSSDGSIATIGSANGIVSGVAAGTTTISYMMGTGCYKTAIVSVNAIPANITGMAAVCEGASITLANATVGGSWITGSGSVAAIGSASGILTGGSAGTANISYVLPTGCKTFAVATVNAQPAAIAGPGALCEGTSITLSNTVAGGSWISGTPSVATIGSSDGVVLGVTSGTTVVTYTLGTSCISTKILTVNATPTAITGTTSICMGDNTTLGVDASGGAWSSSNDGIATVGSVSGIVTGVTAGTVTVTYTVTAGCSITTTVTVNALPATISGPGTVCTGNMIALYSSPTGGTWSSSNTGVATIGTSGIVSGVAAGNTTISYTLSSGCTRTAVVTVYPTPATITGPTAVCAQSTITLDCITAGGTWSSGNTSVATIGSSTGIVTGLGNGPVTMTYTIGSCAATKTIVVNPLPQGITGTLSVCEGAATTLGNTTAGGSWLSSDAGIATVGTSNGAVSGIAAGNATISYVVTASGCYRTAEVTVNQIPASITGTAAICAGSTLTLGNSVSGGTWTSGSPSIASIGSATGVVSGTAAGTTSITYRLSTGCRITDVVTVNTMPAAIGGASVLCDGSSVTLSNTTAGGSWISSDVSVATIGSSSGIVSGLTAGNTTITYTLGTSCIATKILSVTTAPSLISGTAAVCAGTSATLGADVPGGVWSSSNIGVATIGSATGIYTGVAAGVSNITYTIGSCYITSTITINGLPANISGTKTMCAGFGTTLSSSPAGGEWTSSDASIASIGSSTGIVSGVAAGNANITYTLATGCMRATTVTVNTSPAAITGPSSVCYSYAITLADADAGGTWSSSTPAAASVGSATGIVTGLGGGNVNISYTMPGGCLAVKTISVYSLPQGITGTTTVCEGANTTLSNTTIGGTWSSSAAGTATVGTANGIVTGVSAGNTNITYTVSSTGCFRATAVTVNPSPAAITGNAPVCSGTTLTLANSVSGGTWASSYNSTATVGVSTGIVTGGPTAGTVTMTYKLSNSCKATAIVTVNPMPNTISGFTKVCVGGTLNLTNGTAGGAWSSSDGSTATVSGSGVVTGMDAGNVNISYTLPTGCYSLKAVRVNASASGGTITGPSTVGVGATITLANGESGGAWLSGSTGVATVNSTTGVLNGVSGGSAVISYNVNNGCGPAIATYTVTVGGAKPGGNSGSIVNVREMEQGVTEAVVYPNPNRGEFMIRGTVATSEDIEAAIEVVDMSGKVVYRDQATIVNGTLNKQVSLPTGMANGMYMLVLRAGNESKTIHFAVSQ